ncbi:hypothetical protein NEHOM01_1465 [Nematocida homosporus]|uniref:uncharacterized protein n=1 Tax=Nematocida homosporus TaxID=1912981 RepID=UPI002220C055|nr:uncharacterized protein NEHOM01_1465 [Nematocida homosporus]KAI5186432.1 hypothetical protein NEHOM01_1465 [Nematocida homosporus]
MFITLAYGSNGGTARSIAGILAGKIEMVGNLELSGFSGCIVVEMDQIEVNQLAKMGIVVFVCATTGDGECPYNMQGFWWELKRRIWTGAFEQLFYAVVGLGDSLYSKYNYAGKRLFNRMKQVGGVALCGRCDCDSMDSRGVYSALETWVPEFLAGLRSQWSSIVSGPGNEWSKKGLVGVKPATSWGVLKSRRRIAPYGEVDDLSTKGSFYSEVLEVVLQIDKPVGIESATNSDESVRDGKDESARDGKEEDLNPHTNVMTYSPGDVLEVYPENLDYLEFLAEAVEGEVEEAEQFAYLDYQKVPMHHEIGRVYECLVNKQGVRFKDDVPDETLFLGRLQEIAETYDEYYAYVVAPQRTFREVLRDLFLVVRTSAGLFSPIFPRYYTISKCDGCLYSLTVGVVKRYTKLAQPRKGLCSEYLKGLEIGRRVRVRQRKSHMPLEGDLFMICSGTGISLPRATIHAYLEGHLPQVSSIHLLFGFRSVLYDWLHHDELAIGPPMLVHGKTGVVLQYTLLSKDKQRSVVLFAAPSRLGEEPEQLISLGQPSPSDGLTWPAVPRKNYLAGVLHMLDKSILFKNIIISGASRLAKTLPPVIEAILQTQVHFYSECW